MSQASARITPSNRQSSGFGRPDQAVAIIESGEYESPDDGVCRVYRQGQPDRSNLPQLAETRVDQSCNMIREIEGRVNDAHVKKSE